MRRRSQKLNTYSLPLIAEIAQVHNPAFYLFQGFGIRNYQQFAVVDFMFQH